MSANLKDISSREDIVLLLNAFYSKAQKDDVIGSKFDHINMVKHTQVIADFWDGILFGSNQYRGDAFGKHLDLDLSAQDFERWISLFNQTLDDNYQGPIADEAKNRAGTIARVFQHKLGLS
jgi:hemoglobin